MIWFSFSNFTGKYQGKQVECVYKEHLWEIRKDHALAVYVAAVSHSYISIHVCSFTTEKPSAETKVLNWVSAHVRLRLEVMGCRAGSSLLLLLIYRPSRKTHIYFIIWSTKQLAIRWRIIFSAIEMTSSSPLSDLRVSDSRNHILLHMPTYLKTTAFVNYIKVDIIVIINNDVQIAVFKYSHFILCTLLSPVCVTYTHMHCTVKASLPKERFAV